jgi:hypothetical protein
MAEKNNEGEVCRSKVLVRPFTFWPRNHVLLTVPAQNKNFLSLPVDVGI